MRFVDANIFLRFLTHDDDAKWVACVALFQRADLGEEQLTTCETIVAEVVYVLSARAHYGLPRDEIRRRLVPVLSMRGLRFREKPICLRALDLYVERPVLDYEDCLCVAHVERDGIADLLSYDRGFDHVPSVHRVEP